MEKIHWIGIIVGTLVMAFSFLFFGSDFFLLLIGIGAIIFVIPFIISILKESKESKEKEEMFLEFSRNLVESVKSGNPINKSILNVKNKSYGALSPHIRKLANQISIGIPLGSALQTFSRDVNNRTISRALTLIGQAEKAGGNIGQILESVAEAVNMSDKLRKERESASSTLVAQGYLIFVVFMIIILVMQFRILPMMSGLSMGDGGGVNIGGMLGGGGGGIASGGPAMDPKELSNSFLALLMVQGLFSGLIVGKLSKGSIKDGVKHSFALMLMAFLVSTISNIIFG